MTKTALLLFAAALAASAQSVSVTPAAPQGTSMSAELTNNGPTSITAFLVECRMYEGPKVRRAVYKYMDARVNFPDSPVPPGGSRNLLLSPAAGADRYRYDVQLEAALFADGSSTGDPTAIALLRDRRQRVYDAVTGYDSVLRSAWAGGGRLAAVTAVQQEHTSRQQTATQQRLDIARRSAEDLVARYVSDSLGQTTDACDDACSQNRYSRILSGLAAWKALVTNGLSEARSPVQ
ncbi:MAG: hypothetical protein JST11_24130 [Acidobacteria bacterium]|nr:hypothetical protein [Acidobacteriota bacterium]